MGFSRQVYWSGLPCPSPGHLPNSGIEPISLMSPALAGGFFTTSASWEAHIYLSIYLSMLVLNCWPLNFKCILDNLHLYSLPLTLAFWFFLFLAMSHHTQDLSSPTKDQTHAASSGSAVLTTGLPRRSHSYFFDIIYFTSHCFVCLLATYCGYKYFTIFFHLTSLVALYMVYLMFFCLFAFIDELFPFVIFVFLVVWFFLKKCL